MAKVVAIDIAIFDFVIWFLFILFSDGSGKKQLCLLLLQAALDLTEPKLRQSKGRKGFFLSRSEPAGAKSRIFPALSA